MVSQNDMRFRTVILLLEDDSDDTPCSNVIMIHRHAHPGPMKPPPGEECAPLPPARETAAMEDEESISFEAFRAELLK